VLTALGNSDADFDHDGVSDVDEYLADTDPFDANDLLQIIDFIVDGTTNYVTWTVKTTREYTLQHAHVLTNIASWVDGTPIIPSSGLAVIEQVQPVTDTNRFYRVKATPPLAP